MRLKMFNGRKRAAKRLLKNRDYYYHKNEEQLMREKQVQSYEMMRTMTR